MTDDEAATLLGVAYSALLMLPTGSFARAVMIGPMVMIRDQIAFLRHRTPEDIQNEFEGKAGHVL